MSNSLTSVETKSVFKNVVENKIGNVVPPNGVHKIVESIRWRLINLLQNGNIVIQVSEKFPY
jgi:hypothetical protein